MLHTRASFVHAYWNGGRLEVQWGVSTRSISRNKAKDRPAPRPKQCGSERNRLWEAMLKRDPLVRSARLAGYTCGGLPHVVQYPDLQIIYSIED